MFKLELMVNAAVQNFEVYGWEMHFGGVLSVLSLLKVILCFVHSLSRYFQVKNAITGDSDSTLSRKEATLRGFSFCFLK